MIEMQIDYLVANLIDYYRDLDHEARWHQAAKIATNQIERISGRSMDALKKRFIFFASSLKGNIGPASLRDFANLCFKAALDTRAISQPRESELRDDNAALRRRAEQRLKLALSAGSTSDEAVFRVAYDLLKERKEAEAEERMCSMARSHPLSAALLAMPPAKAMAKEDIRNHLLRLKRSRGDHHSGEGVLFGLLQKAQSFSAANIHKLLGDELFSMCRPIGFLDKRSTIILVEVPSSAHMHALSYKKLQILRALKKDPAFHMAQNIRFSIKRGDSLNSLPFHK